MMTLTERFDFCMASLRILDEKDVSSIGMAANFELQRRAEDKANDGSVEEAA